jgi:hypothetical protein
VLLGLVVVAVWEEWNAATEDAGREARELAEVFFLAPRLPQPEDSHLQELARSYARTVVNEEWPLMKRGEVSLKALAILDEIRDSMQGLKPTTKAQQVLYEQGLQQVNDLADARGERLLDAEKGLPAVLWVVLIVGGSRWWAYLPLRPGEHLGARADGRVVDAGHLVGALHRCRSRLPVQGGHTHRPGRLRTGAAEVREQQAK